MHAGDLATRGQRGQPSTLDRHRHGPGDVDDHGAGGLDRRLPHRGRGHWNWSGRRPPALDGLHAGNAGSARLPSLPTICGIAISLAFSSPTASRGESLLRAGEDPAAPAGTSDATPPTGTVPARRPPQGPPPRAAITGTNSRAPASATSTACSAPVPAAYADRAAATAGSASPLSSRNLSSPAMRSTIAPTVVPGLL